MFCFQFIEVEDDTPRIIEAALKAILKHIMVATGSSQELTLSVL